MSEDNWVSACRAIEVEGSRGRDRGRKTWEECMTEDTRSLGVTREEARDRAVWRGAILYSVEGCDFGQTSDPRKRGQRQ